MFWRRNTTIWGLADAKLIVHYDDVSIFSQTLRQDLRNVEATFRDEAHAAMQAEIAV